MKRIVLPFLSLLFIVLSAFEIKTETPHDIIKSVFLKTRKITGMRYTMQKLERIGSETTSQKSSVKMTRNPVKVYSKQHTPKEGIEVLYVAGANGGMALVNPNGFPWVTLKLDPMGSTMRKKQHHTIKDSGYDLVVSILEHLTIKYNATLNAMISEKAPTVWDGHQCFVIEFNNIHFKREKYKVKKGETVLSIAQQYKLSEYMILEENDLDSYSTIPEGTTITIPNDYASKMILFVDKVRRIPLVMKVYDDKGLYEQFEYTSVVLDPVFKSDEFDSGYDDYNF